MSNSAINQHLTYQQFRRPFVRDLAFALACPCVLTSWSAVSEYIEDSSVKKVPIQSHSNEFWQQQFDNYRQRLHELDTTTEYQKLTKFLMNRSSPHRLGFHFEGVMLFWLIDGYRLSMHRFKLITHNLQLVENKITLGELDLIIDNQTTEHHGANQTQNIEHWELAIKFYIGSQPFAPVDWVGLNRQDNLQRKLIHMKDKPFSHDSVTVGDKVYNIDKRYVVIKGRLFKPLNISSFGNSEVLNDVKDFIRPPWLNCGFPIHDWVAYSETDNSEINNNEINNNENVKSTNNNDAIAVVMHKHTQNQLRKTHYVEWFTPRPFYDNEVAEMVQITVELPPIITGLYVMTEFDNTLNIDDIDASSNNREGYLVVKVMSPSSSY